MTGHGAAPTALTPFMALGTIAVKGAAPMSHSEAPSRRLCVHRLGLRRYGEVFELQKRLVEDTARDPSRAHAHLVLVQHPPVITIGRGGTDGNVLASSEALAREGIEVVEVNRGGDVTYHGPGQIVGYPIVHLDRYERDVHRHLRRLEEAMIRALAEFGIAATRDPKYTGVWVGEDKIGAIGVAVRHWITFHGFALNVNTNLSHFAFIRPCGIIGRGVTSMAKVLGRPVDEREVEDALVRAFAEVFDLAVAPQTAEAGV